MDDEQPQLPPAHAGAPPAATGANAIDTSEAGSPDPLAVDLQEGLSDKQSEALVALLHEPTVARAATMIGVHERTLRRWLEERAFKKAYHTARREAFGHAVGLLQRYAPVAVNTMVKVMTADKTPPGVKVAAAAMLLKFGREGIELDDLAARVELLEQAADVTKKW